MCGTGAHPQVNSIISFRSDESQTGEETNSRSGSYNRKKYGKIKESVQDKELH